MNTILKIAFSKQWLEQSDHFARVVAETRY